MGLRPGKNHCDNVLLLPSWKAFFTQLLGQHTSLILLSLVTGSFLPADLLRLDQCQVGTGLGSVFFLLTLISQVTSFILRAASTMWRPSFLFPAHIAWTPRLVYSDPYSTSLLRCFMGIPTDLLIRVPQAEPPLGLLISANGNAVFPVDQTRNLKVILDSFLSLKPMFKSSLRNVSALSSLDPQC